MNKNLPEIEGLINKADNPTELQTRYINEKKNAHTMKNIRKSSGQREQLEKEGWELIKENPKTFRMGFPKKHDVAFEERVWAFFAKMGFDYICKEPGEYALRYVDNNGKTKQKKLDIFAADKEAIIIVECKSRERRSSKSSDYTEKIRAYSHIKGKLSKSAQKLFDGKQKIAYIWATNNIRLGQASLDQLSSDSWHHFNQDVITYHEMLVDHLGNAAKYQLFGRLFEGQDIPEMPSAVPAIKDRLGGRDCFMMSLPPEILLRIGYVLHRTDYTLERAKAFQRLVRKNKLKQVREFVSAGGYFPNSVIINIINKRKSGRDIQPNFEDKDVEVDIGGKVGLLKLPKKYRSAFIIDGQHRIYGYSDVYKKEHTIPVVAFYNLKHDEQTRIFHDINSNQKKPPANLLESIKAELNWGSDNEAVAISALKTRLLVELNNDEKSPFYYRIVVSEEKREGLKCLTLKTIKDQGIGTASNYFGRFKGGRQIQSGYLTKETLDKTYSNARSFFNAVFSYIDENYPEQWQLGNAIGGLIAMNVGVISILKICDQLIDFEMKFHNLVPGRLSGQKLAEKLYNYLDFIIDRFKEKDIEEMKELRRKSRGSGGPKNLLPYFQEAINMEVPEFVPEGLSEWIEAQTGKFKGPAYEVVTKTVRLIKHKIIKKLQDEFGKSGWWIEGMPPDVKEACAILQVKDLHKREVHEYLEERHYKKIIVKNWKYFSSSESIMKSHPDGFYFASPDYDGKKGWSVGKDKKLEWFSEKFLKIRNKVMHEGSLEETITESELKFLESTFEWLNDKLSNL